MNLKTMWKLVPAVLACCVVGAASAKLPAPPPPDPAKAAEAAKKKTEADKKGAEAKARADDRAVANYKKSKGMAATAPAKTAAVAPKKK